jgi:hypothetical protein
MAGKTAKAPEVKNLDVIQMREGHQDFCILGVSPFVYNSLSNKAKTDGSTGLLSAPKKNRSELESVAKHEPWKEYRDSVYRHKGDRYPTRLMIPGRMFKGAMRSVAARIPGVFGTEVGQLIWVSPEEISLYGIPQIWTTTVRSANTDRTPDVRTRAIVPEWACRLHVRYIMPNIKAPNVVKLLGNSGLICGVGDARAEKGKFSNGQFHLVDEDDERFQRIVAEGTREAQDEALRDPLYYDAETEELLSWYIEERRRRDGSFEHTGDDAPDPGAQGSQGEEEEMDEAAD